MRSSSASVMPSTLAGAPVNDPALNAAPRSLVEATRTVEVKKPVAEKLAELQAQFDRARVEMILQTTKETIQWLKSLK